MAEQGYILTAAEGKLLANTVKAVRGIRGDGVAAGDDGIFIRQRREGYSPTPGPYPVEVVTVVTDQGDYLTCRPYGITADAEGNIDDTHNVNIAKPWDLRSSPFNTKTLPNKDGTLLSYAYTGDQARTVTDTTDSSTEDQVVVPAYVEEQTISGTRYTGSQIVVKRIREGTGVTATDSAGLTSIVEYEDANHAGRAWAEDNA